MTLRNYLSLCPTSFNQGISLLPKALRLMMTPSLCKMIPSAITQTLKNSWGIREMRGLGAMILREKSLFTIQKCQEDIMEEELEEDLWRAFEQSVPSEKCLCDDASSPFSSMARAFNENCFAYHPSLSNSLCTA